MDETTQLVPYGALPLPVARVCQLTNYCASRDLHPHHRGPHTDRRRGHATAQAGPSWPGTAATAAQEIELSRRPSRSSSREREVLELLAEGHRAAASAERFVVSMTTVLRTQIRAKLDANSQLEAMALPRQQPRV